MIAHTMAMNLEPSHTTNQAGFYQRKLKQTGAVLAPMAGYSDAPMRQLCSEQGALWTVSEMISARGLVLGNDNENLNLGRPYAGEKDRVVQLFGADAEILAEAVQKVEAWFAPAAIDLNMGCPVPKVRGKGGACLLQTPELASRLVRAMKSATSLDVSVKIRLGWESNHSLEIASALAEAGADLVSIHGRTSKQRYRGEADWDAIATVAEHVTIPVIGSGDVTSVEQAEQRKRLGVASVMIGRGAVGNPWLFRALQEQSSRPPSLVERAQMALRHAQLQLQFYTVPDRRDKEKWRVPSLKPLRKVLPKYLPELPENLPEMSELHSLLTKVETLADVEQILAPFLENPTEPNLTQSNLTQPNLDSA